MVTQGMRYNSAIIDFQRKRGGDSIAFFVPFLTRDMDLLDVGCGPGTITAGFADVVRTVTGLDLEPKAIAAANQMVAAAGHANLGFVVGDMTSLPFEDGSFDAVFFHAVLYHLGAAKLRKTLAEALRVLKPGGLIVTRDADAGGNVIYPETSGILLSLDLWQRWYEHSSIDAVYFGRRQEAVLRSHGFVPVWSGASHVNHSADAPTRRETVEDAKRSLESLSEGLVQRGLADRQEIETALSAWDRWGSDPDAVYLRCRCECVATVPRV
ncbi:Demethylrebeccamycin-D-glucose O-methyltransferase [Ensifer psoraleae]|uniref:class I SAM-dependent methyltransferase n=1 Tax=Sinorhizobium psoraleae TaxID=520838 RepID=UPI001568C4C5|nr:class I SAM-dependent methyltransferase [Sinorhizobium psoraleae]NRP73929.1 Demethylrebeccamycin-D-glucose O-methyltransferase [Sinorhizobium psoraleae]